MLHPEENTIKAINSLREAYPYAATILAFTAIERQLKRYILSHRKDKLRSKEVILFNRQTVKFENYLDQPDEVFIDRVLTKLTLSKVEAVIDISQGSFSKDRDDVMHSNLYLTAEQDLSDEERHARNVEHFRRAKKLLMRAFKQFSNIRIVEENGELAFKT